MSVWLNIRERLLTSPAFHKTVARLPFTRPILRKRQSELFDIVSGFVYSQILSAVVELDLLERVAGRGKTIPQLAKSCDLGEDEMRRLAEGAAALRLLQRDGDRFKMGDLGSALAVNPGVLAMIRHHGALYKDLENPVELLRRGRGDTNLSRYWDYALSDDPAKATEDDVSAYTDLMSTSQLMVAEEIGECFNFEDHDVLLDVGGGDGTFLREVYKHAPHLKTMLFDLPTVTETAALRFKQFQLAENTEVFGGSFFDDPLPKGADLISLVRIIHDHDDEPAMKIMQACYDALPKGGRLIICEPMSTGGSALRISDAYFNFYLYAMGSGRPRSPEILEKMLETVGFSRIYRVPTRAPLITSILSAHK